MEREEAIEIVRKLYNDSLFLKKDKEAMITLIPELAESEDERIKTFLHHTFTAQYLCKDKLGKWHGEPVVNILSWLEKQGEHAKFRDSIQVGDKVTRNQDGVLVNLSQLNRVAKKDEKQGEQKPAELSEEYIADVFEKVGLAKIVREQSNDALTIALQDAMIKLSKVTLQQKPAWSEEDEKSLLELSQCCDLSKTQVQWLLSLKDRVQPQLKQEWSEVDEANLDYLIDFCNGYYNGNKPVLTESTARSLSNWLYRFKSCEIMSNTNKIDNEEAEKTIHLACEFIRHHSRKGDSIGGIDCSALTERLKSLRPQSQWKPSDKQIEAVRIAAEIGTANNSWAMGILKSMYQDLKKLKE